MWAIDAERARGEIARESDSGRAEHSPGLGCQLGSTSGRGALDVSAGYAIKNKSLNLRKLCRL
jgi:hypothetical protein